MSLWNFIFLECCLILLLSSIICLISARGFFASTMSSTNRSNLDLFVSFALIGHGKEVLFAFKSCKSYAAKVNFLTGAETVRYLAERGLPFE